MEKALVLGASGGMGYAITKELSKRGVKTTAFARSNQTLKHFFQGDTNVNIFSGDVFDEDKLQTAADGVNVIFHAINLPYADWKTKLLPMTKNVVSVAKHNEIRLAVVDNIYSYGKNTGQKISEDTPKRPNTKKGQLRLEMNQMIEQAGIAYIIAHFPDFYGPYAENGQLNYTLKQILAGKQANFVGNQNLKREHIFTPDGAKAIVTLALDASAYGAHWNIPATDVISGKELVKMMRQLTNYKKGVSTVTRNMIRFLGLFNKQMREFAEMQYLNEDPVILSGKKYEKLIGEIPSTSYKDGLRSTIEAYKR